MSVCALFPLRLGGRETDTERERISFAELLSVINMCWALTLCDALLGIKQSMRCNSYAQVVSNLKKKKKKKSKRSNFLKHLILCHRYLWL